MTQLLLDYIQSCADRFPNSYEGYKPTAHRCSVDLSDGTHLPCVMLLRQEPFVDLALRRFREEKKRRSVFGKSVDPYRKMVAHFITSGNRISPFDIVHVVPSRYAIPLEFLAEVHGETHMSTILFVLEMKDGQAFNFAASYDTAFFELPAGREFTDVRKVHEHCYVDEGGEVKSVRENRQAWWDWYRRNPDSTYHSRPYFECFVDSD